jgi:hypothetical protein
MPQDSRWGGGLQNDDFRFGFSPALTHAKKHVEKHAKKHVEKHAEMHGKKQATRVSCDRAGEWVLVKGPAAGGCPAA